MEADTHLVSIGFFLFNLGINERVLPIVAETNEILVSADQPRSPNPAGQRMVRLTIVEVPLLSPPKSGCLTNLRPNVRGLEQVVQRQVNHADVIRKDQNQFLYSIEQSANYSDQEHQSEWN